MIKKTFFAVSCMLLLVFAGCKKEEQASSPIMGTKSTCAPYRLVGGNQLDLELTDLINCSFFTGDRCLANVLYASAGAYINYNIYQYINTYGLADQSTLISQGRSVALSMAPAGYHVYNVSVVDHPTFSGSGYFKLYISVIYRSCGNSIPVDPPQS